MSLAHPVLTCPPGVRPGPPAPGARGGSRLALLGQASPAAQELGGAWHTGRPCLKQKKVTAIGSGSAHSAARGRALGLGGGPRGSFEGLHTLFCYFGDQPEKTPFACMILKPGTRLLLSGSILKPLIKRAKYSYTFTYHFLLGLFRKLQWSSRPWAPAGLSPIGALPGSAPSIGGNLECLRGQPRLGTCSSWSSCLDVNTTWSPLHLPMGLLHDPGSRDHLLVRPLQALQPLLLAPRRGHLPAAAPGRLPSNTCPPVLAVPEQGLRRDA